MNNQEFIEKYFRKELSEKEEVLWRHKMESDPVFAKEMIFLENLRTVVQKRDDENFKNELALIEKNHATKSNIRPLVIWLSSAAAVLMLVTFIFWKREPDYEDLFLEYFIPAENVSFPLVRGGDNNAELSKAFSEYQEKNYAQSLAYFTRTHGDRFDEAIFYYEGNALLATGQSKKAIDRFKSHIASKDSLRYRSYWYLALAYLSTNQPDEAKDTLKKLLEKSDFRKKEAQELLDHL